MTWCRKIDGMAHQARKRFGQHFLVDQSIIAAIISRIRPHSLDRVLEIGPGLGAMTFSLIDHLSTLDVVELDRDLVTYWQAKEISKLQIYEADALQFNFLDWANLAQQDLVLKNRAGRVKIVGNLPKFMFKLGNVPSMRSILISKEIAEISPTIEIKQKK